jgi:hypothetical protein
MIPEELRGKLKAETRNSESGNHNWDDKEVGDFILGLNNEGLLKHAPRDIYLSEKTLLLSDEELMFRWAIFKM